MNKHSLKIIRHAKTEKERVLSDSSLKQTKNKSLLQNSFNLGGLAPDFKRSETAFYMSMLIILTLHIFSHCLFHPKVRGRRKG